MQKSLLKHYTMLFKRWAWLMILGIVICGGVTYVVSKLIPPVYQASSTVIVTIQSSTSAYDNVNASEQIAPTYAQLITSTQVLQPVVAQHPDLTLLLLRNMVTAKFQSNTTLIEIDVSNNSPDLAVKLADEVGQSFQGYADTQLPGNVQFLPADRPVEPLWPRPKVFAGIGALVGLGLALSLIVIFEWIDDRPARPEEVEEILGVETLTDISRFPRKQSIEETEQMPGFKESIRMLGAGLNVAQAIKPFKLLMITSALPGEGKSTVATNLATSLAIAGKRVLLVDADLYHPTLDQRFQVGNASGFSGLLWDAQEQLDIASVRWQETPIPRLFVLPSGKFTSRATELLQSSLADQVFTLFKQAPFDYIIFDSSPLLTVADARILAFRVQALVVVIDASKTSRGALRRTRQILGRIRCRTIGSIVNKSPWRNASETHDYLSSSQQESKELVMPELPDTPVGHETDTNFPEVTIRLHKLDKK
jgi:capsular exopolysaccharide synthesis family protein